MPIAIQEKEGTNQLFEEEYRNEAELQAFLERSPYLLVADSEPQVATVLREVRLPAAGFLDLLLVDEEGVPPKEGGAWGEEFSGNIITIH